jgi:hypothetical protein
MESRLTVSLAILVAAIFATAMTIVLQQIPTEFTGSQHDSLPVALAVGDPGLFADDPFVGAVQHQPTWFWHLVGRPVPLQEPVGLQMMTVGVAFLNFLFFVAIGVLTRCLGGNGGACALAIVLLGGMGDPLVGANYIIGNHVTASSVVAGPLVLAVALAVRGRWVWALALVGACANLHVLQAAYVGGLLISGYTAQVWFGQRRDWMSLAKGMAALVLAAAPVLWLIATAPASEVPPDWANVVRRGHVIHYYLFSQLNWQILRTLALVLLLVGLVLALWKRNATCARLLLGMLTGWLVLFVIVGGLMADVVGVPLAIKLQPLRATAWMVILATPFAAAVLGELLRDAPRAGATQALLGALLAMGVLTMLRPFSGALNMQLGPLVLLFSLLFVLALRWPTRLDRDAPVAAALALVGPGSILLILLATLPGWSALATLAGFQLLLLLLFVMGVVWALRSFIPPWQIRHVALIAATTGAVISALVLMDRVQANEPLLHHPRDDAWHEAAAFLATNTPSDAVLQGDPRRTGLRTVTRRTVFFEQSDDHALYVDPSSLIWLRERAELLRIPLVKTYGKPAPWPALAVPWAELARDHGVTHAMLPAEVMLRDDVIFENQQWRIYKLSAPTAKATD